MAFVPPKGTNFRLTEAVPIAELCGILGKVVDFVQRHCQSRNLERFDDWWQHDGLHFESGLVSFSELREIIGDPSSLHNAMPGDFEVHAWAFLLRVETGTSESTPISTQTIATSKECST